MTTVAEGKIPSGRYALQFHGAGPESLVAVVDVPKGFETWNGNVLWAAGAGSGGLMFWTVDRLPPDPCRAVWKSYVDPGPSVEDLADALLAQKGRKGSVPEPVTFNGYDGLYLEFRVPETLDTDTCVGASYDTWASIYGRRYQTPPGSRDRIWILDVEGQRLIINLVEVPGKTDLTTLRAMLRSVELMRSA